MLPSIKRVRGIDSVRAGPSSVVFTTMSVRLFSDTSFRRHPTQRQCRRCGWDFIVRDAQRHRVRRSTDPSGLALVPEIVIVFRSGPSYGLSTLFNCTAIRCSPPDLHRNRQFGTHDRVVRQDRRRRSAAPQSSPSWVHPRAGPMSPSPNCSLTAR